MHVCRQTSTFDTCVGIRDRSCVKRSKAWQHVSTEPWRRADLFLRRTASSPSVRKRSSSSRSSSFWSRNSLFAGHPLSYMSPYPKDPKAHLLEKLPCVSALWLARRIIKATVCHRFSLPPPSNARAYVRKLSFIPWLLGHSFDRLRNDMKISAIKVCYIGETTQI